MIKINSKKRTLTTFYLMPNITEISFVTRSKKYKKQMQTQIAYNTLNAKQRNRNKILITIKNKKNNDV